MNDPITFEVIRNALVAATDEMVLALRRSESAISSVAASSACRITSKRTGSRSSVTG